MESKEHMTENTSEAGSGKVSYNIMDPTGNITALVESGITPENRSAVAAWIMQKHPEVEQVGFVGFPVPEEEGVHAVLRMAGGEFCGNASMCAAALYLMDSRPEQAADPDEMSAVPENRILLRVSGTKQPVEVRLRKNAPGEYSAGIRMPAPLSVGQAEFRFGEMGGTLPVVHMEGISHIIIEPESPFACLQKDRRSAEEAVRAWCEDLRTEGLGLMFLEEMAASEVDDAGQDISRACEGVLEVFFFKLTPLVIIPGSGTLFWERSCASGSAAAGMYLAEKADRTVSLVLKEPGGILRVSGDPAGEDTWLFGRTKLLRHFHSSLQSEKAYTE